MGCPLLYFGPTALVVLSLQHILKGPFQHVGTTSVGQRKKHVPHTHWAYNPKQWFPQQHLVCWSPLVASLLENDSLQWGVEEIVVSQNFFSVFSSTNVNRLESTARNTETNRPGSAARNTETNQPGSAAARNVEAKRPGSAAARNAATRHKRI